MNSLIGSAVRVINEQGKFVFHGILADILRPNNHKGTRYLILVDKKLKEVQYGEIRVDIPSWHTKADESQIAVWDAKVRKTYKLPEPKSDTSISS